MRLLPSSLTGRLVATVVVLVAAVCVAVGAVTAIAMRAELTGQLDQQVATAQQQFERGPSFGEGDGPPDLAFPRGQGSGTIQAVSVGAQRRGALLDPQGRGRPLSSAALDVLDRVPADGRAHTVRLSHLGSYRVLVSTGQGDLRLVTGLSTHDTIDEPLGSLIGWELLLTAGAVALVAIAGDQLVRRQLRPLREVARTAHSVSELPLDSGEIGETVRVPERLTDSRTEVGQVGAALNTMLAHVESALDSRHRSEQQVRQFVADASHELRTPLTTITGYAELSRRTPEDAAQLAHALAKVDGEAHRMAGLVDDLLLLARLDAGRPLERVEVDLTRLVLEAVADARVVAADHRWRLDLPGEPVLVEGDEQRLHQVLTNLLTNARLHTPPSTTVTVGVHRAEHGAELTVHDTGPGLPEGLGAHVFERFTRGDSARTRASGGVGLGLSLVEAITTAHGGAVEVRSEPGSTTFTVTMP
ncbi:MAG: sensor histidine kinase [Nocardioidaceae bacterium]